MGQGELPLREAIPLPHDPNVYVSYKHLLLLEERGEASVLPDGASDVYSIADLLGTVRVAHKRTEDEFIRLLKLAIAETDDEKTAAGIANDILLLQPNFMGMGINLNALLRKLSGRGDQKDTQSERSIKVLPEGSDDRK